MPYGFMGPVVACNVPRGFVTLEIVLQLCSSKELRSSFCEIASR